MDDITLPPEIEQFAAEAVASGRYPDVSAVLAAGVGLLRRTEAQRDMLRTSVMAAEAHGEHHGFLSLDAVMRDADTLLKEMAGARGWVVTRS